MLQVGGVQDAVTTAAPGCFRVRLQVVPALQPVELLPAATEAGWEEVQVKGGLGTMQPWTSTAVAVIVSVPPFALATKLVWPVNSPLALTFRLMHCTGQVSK